MSCSPGDGAQRADVSISRRRSILAQAAGQVMFAPTTVMHGGHRLVAVTVGAAADRVFVPREAGQPGTRPWYVSGRNRLKVAQAGSDGLLRLEKGTTVPVPPGTRDVTGASLVSDGTRLRLWFSALAAGRWSIYHTVSTDDGRTWSAPDLALEPGASEGTDGQHVLLPTVLRRDDCWWMWYAGRDGHHRRIHLARSGDGVTWRRHGVALDIGGAGSPDAYAADCPAVARHGEQIVLVYGAGTSRSLAAAVSADGTTWRKIGPILHRGLPGDPDSQYAFYPALLSTGPAQAELLYAGEDDDGQWTILRAGIIDLRALADRPTVALHTPALDAAVARIRTEVTDEFLAEPADCHGPAPAWHSADNAIEQLRPSSTPVFAIRGASAVRRASAVRGDLVVKLGRSRAHAEREFDGIQILARYLPVPAACLHYQGERAAVITEYVPGTRLSSLAIGQPDRFGAVLADLVTRLARAAADTIVSAPLASEADEAPQSAALLASWTGDIVARLLPWSDHQLRVNDMPIGLTIGDITASSERLTARSPHALSFSNGDLHLGNVVVAPRGSCWWLLDFEFAGQHDLDYITAGLLSSCLKHANLITEATAKASDGEIHLNFGLAGEWGPRLLGTSWLLDRFAALPVDPARIFAFILPSLRFRLVNDVRGGDLPAGGLAALAMAAKMTEQDRP
jgi:hypothetical protein